MSPRCLLGRQETEPTANPAVTRASPQPPHNPPTRHRALLKRRTADDHPRDAAPGAPSSAATSAVDDRSLTAANRRCHYLGRGRVACGCATFFAGLLVIGRAHWLGRCADCSVLADTAEMRRAPSLATIAPTLSLTAFCGIQRAHSLPSFLRHTAG